MNPEDDSSSTDKASTTDKSDLPAAKSGIELAREALAQAKADARKRGSVPGQSGKRKNTRQVVVRE
ncbi:DUF721 domain-containing protein, partial [Actinomadura adrarensis]